MSSRIYTDDYRPTVGARVRPTVNLLEILSKPSDRGTVTECHLEPDATTPLDEGVWGLLDEYDGEYPHWIARVAWDDNEDAADLVGPGEIMEVDREETLRIEYDAAVRLSFCPYCLHDLWYTDWCHECETNVPKDFKEFLWTLDHWKSTEDYHEPSPD